MAKAKKKEIKELSEKEMRTRVTALGKEMFEARMKNSLGQLANPLEIRATRRELARLKTHLNMTLAAKANAGR